MNLSSLRHRFISLKWQALILTSVILLAIVVGFTSLSYINLNQQFHEQRDAAHQRSQQELRGLLSESGLRLQQVGAMVSSLSDIHEPLLAEDPLGTAAAFDPFWSAVQLNVGIDSAAVYSRSQRLLLQRGSSQANGDVLADWLTRVLEEESPVTVLDCSSGCMQYGIVPILARGRNAGAAVVGIPLVDVLLSFRRVSGTDLGLIVPVLPDTATPGERLPNWQAEVAALTDAQRNFAVLRQVAAQYPDLKTLNSAKTTIFQERYYEVRLIPLPGLPQNNSAQFVLVEDISDAVNRIHTATGQNLALGATGLVLSEALLLTMLWAPMSRLRRAITQLPLLAQSGFERVRRAISPPRYSRFVRDETDVLTEAAIDLSYQLEALEDQVAQHTRVLAEQRDEQAREKDFIARLLDTAQVIILTQDARGLVRMVNRWGEALTGFTEEELIGRPFMDLLAPEVGNGSVQDLLQPLRSGKEDHVRSEGNMVCRDGSVRNIAWYHSRLTGRSDEDSVILSAGLDITDRKQAELRLAWLADHDPLTGLYNRRRFQEELTYAVAAAERHDRSGALLFLDLDQFKYINDTVGHQAGDQLLKMVGDTLARITRKTDVVGRLGGDEFAVIIDETDAAKAIEGAKRVTHHIGQVELPMPGRVYKVTASIGIALFPLHGDDAQELLAAADVAMYQAKESGRGNWHLFSAEDQSRERMRQWVYWKEQIERALAEDRFILHFQPIRDLLDGSTTHYEVLVRMRGDDGSIIAPGNFIETAERTGLIHAIDRVVLAKAVRYLAWLQGGGDRVMFTVNLSGRAFEDPELLPRLQELLEETQLNPAKLILEITETAAIADLSGARNLMLSIKRLGCRFALDDFGTGFSSFYYLKEVPADFVKIDGSFVRQLAENRENQVLVKALSEVAQNFGKKVIAEHVENSETLALLREYKVDYAQGYFVGRPGPASVLLESELAQRLPGKLQGSAIRQSG